MARSSKCRVLVSGGKPVVATHTPPSRQSGVAVEVGVSTPWREIAKTPEALRAPCPSSDNPLIELDDEVYAVGMQIGDSGVDPRDVPLRKLDEVLAWALSNYPWIPEQRTVIEALWFESGDVAAVSRICKRPLALVEKLLNRARSEVVMAAKAKDWEEGFAHTRLSGNWPHRVSTMRVEPTAIWFAQPQPMVIDWTEVVLWGSDALH